MTPHARKSIPTHRVVQIGIQSLSGPAVEKVRGLLTPERVGTITQIHAHHYRNAPYGGWKRQIPADCDPGHVDWKDFQGDAQQRPFDPNRVINWRFYWDYSGGNMFENMVHQVGFWFKLMNLKVPESVTMTGGNYLSPEMELPDTMDVSMSQPEKLLFTWNSMFGNKYFGEGHDLILGNKGTIVRNEEDQVTYQSEAEKAESGASTQAKAEAKAAPDIVGGSDATMLHMQNFVDCVRSRREPNCPFEIGFRSAVACQMAMFSYRQGRTVHWDEGREEIV